MSLRLARSFRLSIAFRQINETNNFQNMSIAVDWDWCDRKIHEFRFFKTGNWLLDDAVWLVHVCSINRYAWLSQVWVSLCVWALLAYDFHFIKPCERGYYHRHHLAIEWRRTKWIGSIKTLTVWCLAFYEWNQNTHRPIHSLLLTIDFHIVIP